MEIEKSKFELSHRQLCYLCAANGATELIGIPPQKDMDKTEHNDLEKVRKQWGEVVTALEKDRLVTRMNNIVTVPDRLTKAIRILSRPKSYVICSRAGGMERGNDTMSLYISLYDPYTTPGLVRIVPVVGVSGKEEPAYCVELLESKSNTIDNALKGFIDFQYEVKAETLAITISVDKMNALARYVGEHNRTDALALLANEKLTDEAGASLLEALLQGERVSINVLRAHYSGYAWTQNYLFLSSRGDVWHLSAGVKTVTIARLSRESYEKNIHDIGAQIIA